MANSDKIMDRYYGKIESKLSSLRTRERIHWMVKNVTGDSVIDIGTSQGILPILLGREGFNVLGIDIEDASIKSAKIALEDEATLIQKNIEFRVEDIFTIETDVRYDTAVLGEVIEHIGKKDKLIEIIHSLLNEDGRLILTTPYGYLDFHDHKHTFYLYNILSTVEPLFECEEYFVKDKLFYYIGKRRSEIDKESKFNLSLTDILEMDEELFSKIERDSFIEKSNLKLRINRLEERAKKSVSKTTQPEMSIDEELMTRIDKSMEQSILGAQTKIEDKIIHLGELIEKTISARVDFDNDITMKSLSMIEKVCENNDEALVKFCDMINESNNVASNAVSALSKQNNHTVSALLDISKKIDSQNDVLHNMLSDFELGKLKQDEMFETLTMIVEEHYGENRRLFNDIKFDIVNEIKNDIQNIGVHQIEFIEKQFEDLSQNIGVQQIEFIEKQFEDLSQNIKSTLAEDSQRNEAFERIIGVENRVVKIESDLAEQGKRESVSEQETIENEVKKLRAENDKLKRRIINSDNKIDNLLSTSSMRYRIGDIIIQGMKSVKDFMAIPYRLIKLLQKHRNGEIVSVNPTLRKSTKKKAEIGCIKFDSKPTILFMPTNGAGLGHLTRTLSVARRLKKMYPKTNIIFLSTSPALPYIKREGFLAHYVPSKMLFDESMTASQWNNLLKDHLKIINANYNVTKVVFDGAFPYAGLLAGMKEFDDCRKFWIKRGQAKGDAEKKRVIKEKSFDTIIVPTEAGEIVPQDTGNKKYVDPIIYLERDELMEREQVRKMLNIGEDKIVVYVQLGAGQINDLSSDIGMIFSEIMKRENMIMVLGESLIGDRVDIVHERVIIIKDYPNSMYLNGFDFAISAVGYNSFHELVCFGVPTIFIPNTHAKTDDQLKRAKLVETYNAGVCIEELTNDTISAALDQMSSAQTLSEMRENALGVILKTGGRTAADIIAN